MTGPTGRGGGFVGGRYPTGASANPAVIERCPSLAPSVGPASATVQAFRGEVLGAPPFASNSYYANGAVPHQVAAGLTALGSLAVTQQGSFAGFDFATTWRMSTANPLSPYAPGLLTPVLAWQCGLAGVTCAP